MASIHLIAVIKARVNSKSLLGVRIIDSDTESIKDVPLKNFVAVLSKGVEVANCKIDGDTIIGTNGSLDRFPVIVNGKLRGDSPLVVLEKVNGGFKVCDWSGNIKKLKDSDVIEYASKNGIANGKLVSKDNKTTVSAIKGEYNTSESASVPKTSTKVSAKANASKASTSNVPRLKGRNKVTDDNGNTRESTFSGLDVVNINRKAHDRLDEIDPKTARKDRVTGAIIPGTALTLEQKMARAYNIMRDTRPFYYCILMQMTAIPVEGQSIPTFGVTLKNLYYNVDFLKELTNAELQFVLLHEVCHIAMMHRSRQRGRKHELWNIACDYYINKLLCDEFDCSDTKVGYAKDGRVKGDGVQMAKGGLYNANISVEKDTPEKIYDELMDAYKKAGQQQNGQGNGQSGQQSGQGGQSSSQSGQQSGQSGQGGQGGQNSGQSGQGGQPGQDGQGGQGNGVTQIDFRGQKINIIEGDNSGDLVQDSSESGKSDEAKDSESKAILQNAKTNFEQTGYTHGRGSGFIQRSVEKQLAPKIMWNRLLRQHLIKSDEVYYSYNTPDVRFISQGKILPGPRKAEPDRLEGVKVCIDTSGSIGDKELGIVMTQLEQLLRTYSADVEFIFWDDGITNTLQFESKSGRYNKQNIVEMYKVMKTGAIGGGGTDVNCVFEYLENQAKGKIDKQLEQHMSKMDELIGANKKRSKQTCVGVPATSVIIFTDGFFGAVDSKYKKFFNKKTIWVIQDEYKEQFNAPFGVKADYK